MNKIYKKDQKSWSSFPEIFGKADTGQVFLFVDDHNTTHMVMKFFINNKYYLINLQSGCVWLNPSASLEKCKSFTPIDTEIREV